MSNSIWIAEDDHSLRRVMEKALQRAGYHVLSFVSGDALLEGLSRSTPRVIVSDIRMPGTDGLQLLEKLHLEYPNIPVIITTAHSDLDSAVAAYQGGAFEYLPKPFDLEELNAVVARGLSFSDEQRELQRQSEVPVQDIIGEAPAMQEVFRAIGRLSHSNITVLINGQSGTGKELVAQALHRHSPRRKGVFVALNMAAIPRDLIESELFGHEKGAFTGAAQRREGRFEQANGGTLFLDEIGDMPQEAQTRLLRVLADGEFYRVGGHKTLKVDVRIIAATHQNLEDLVANGRFREDLYHRLNVIRIHLPRLAERSEDIPRLLQHFFQRAARELEVEPKLVSGQASDFLCKLPWPGNVRQLENVCRWLTVMAAGREVQVEDLPAELLVAGGEHQAQPVSDEGQWTEALRVALRQQLLTSDEPVLTEILPLFERTLIEEALNATGGRKKEAAERLGWGRNTLTRKLQDYQME